MDPKILGRRIGNGLDSELTVVAESRAGVATLLATVIQSRPHLDVSSADVDPAIQNLTATLTHLDSAASALAEARKVLLDVGLISIAER